MSLEPLNVRAIARKGESEHGAGLIEIKQLPVIAERLREVKDSVELTLKDALSLACTEETVRDVKAKRAELRKQFDALEEQRKAVKTAVLEPYEQFEGVYKECISDPFRKADLALRTEIDAIEGELKKRCIDGLRRYFAELCLANHIDWLPFDTAMELGGIKVTLATAKAREPKEQQEILAAVVTRVADCTEQIRGMEDAPEIMAEYKKCFDIGKAIVEVTDRKKRIAAEREKAERMNAERAAEEERVQKVKAAMPVAEPAPPEPQAQPKPQEKTFARLTFTMIDVTRSQAIRVREFLKQEGIKYE